MLNRTPLPPRQARTSDKMPKRAGRVTINPADSSSAEGHSTSDDHIFEHNKLLQQSILEVLDRETDRFAEELQERTDQVNEIRASKEELAVFLSHQITENKRLNEQLLSARTSLEKISNESKTIKMRNKQLTVETIRQKKLIENKDEKMTSMNEDMEQQKELVKGMQLATAAFHSDIKVRTLVQQRLENDNEELTITIDDLKNNVSTLYFV
jgi:hypothetical protein